MGKAKSHDTYETIPANHGKASSRATAPPDNVRYVKDPVGEAPDTNYAYHITYHTNTANNNDRYATAANIQASSTLPAQHLRFQEPVPVQRAYTQTLPGAAHHDKLLARALSEHPFSGTQPNQSLARQLSDRSSHHQHHANRATEMQAHEHLVRKAASEKSPNRIAYLPNETFGVPLPPIVPDAYTTQRLRHFTDEGALETPYVTVSEGDADYDKLKDSKQGKSGCACACPPWWGWVIIFLVVCLIGAVVYFIFSQIINKSDKTTTAYTPQNITLTSPMSTHTTQASASIQSPTVTVTVTSPLSTSTMTVTVSPSGGETFHDDLPLAFVVSKDTRSLHSQSSSRILSDSTSLAGCWQDCLSRKTPCFGVDFNEQWNTCHVLNAYDYKLEPIGTTHKTNNYRRTFTLRSFCEEAFYFQEARTFASNVRYRTLPDSVDTLTKCRAACLGPFRNGHLKGGYDCTAGVFNVGTQTCRITNTPYHPNTLKDSSSSKHFINDGVECIRVPEAACSVKFSSLKDQGPLDLASHAERVEARSIPQCATACLNYQNASGATCQGFLFSYDSVECSMYTGVRSAALGTVQGSDFYGIDLPSCTICGFELNANLTAQNGIYQDARSRRSCQTRCEGWTSRHQDEVCYGYDIRWLAHGDVDCHVIIDPEASMDEHKDTDYYVRDPACKGCPRSRFLTTVHTSPLGGRTYGLTSLRGCARACQRTVSPPANSRCYGFTFDRATKNCRHFHTFHYDLNAIGTSPGTDHYRRMFTCVESKSLECNAYNVSRNTQAASNGVTQPWDIHSVQSCQDRCLGYGVSTNSTCYGLDFNVRTSRCTVHLDAQYMLGEPGDAPGTDHYTRLAVTAAAGC